jgi:hypothetical protein
MQFYIISENKDVSAIPIAGDTQVELLNVDDMDGYPVTINVGQLIEYYVSNHLRDLFILKKVITEAVFGETVDPHGDLEPVP